MTSWQDDMGGGYHDRWDGIIDNKCPECGVDAGQKCWNSITETVKHIPCWRRARVSA